MTDTIVRKAHVYQAISKVKLALAKHGGITKDRDAPAGAGRYQFRSIDDMYNVMCELTAEEGLVMIPRVIGEPVIHFSQNAKGNTQTHVFLRLEVDFCSAVDGSTHTGCFFGEAIDSSDKASNKAMSAAFKYAHIMPFQIPTHGEVSDDTEAYVTQAAPPQAAPKQADKPGPRKSSPTAAMREEQAQQEMPNGKAANGNGSSPELPIPEGVTPMPSNALSAVAHNANTFGVLHAVAKQANKEGADPAVWNTIRNRCVVLLSSAPDMATLKESKDLVRDLGSPELLVKAANIRYQELTAGKT